MLQNGTTKVNKRTKKNVYCNTSGLVEQGVLGIVIGVVICSFQFVANSLLCPPRAVGVALCDTAIRPFVRLSVPALGAQLPYAIGTLAACSSAVCGVRRT